MYVCLCFTFSEAVQYKQYVVTSFSLYYIYGKVLKMCVSDCGTNNNEMYDVHFIPAMFSNWTESMFL